MDRPEQLKNLRKISIRALLNSKDFNIGYKDAKKGLPFNENKSWSYERGRQFAFCYQGALKWRNKIRIEALWALHSALKNKYVI